jgi:murein DD-endopeptidase
MRMSFRNSSLTRRGFLGALASVAPVIASAGRRDGIQPSDALAVSPLDDWGVVETTSGRYLVGELIIRNQRQLPSVLLELRLGDEPSAPPTIRLASADLQSRMANASNNVPVPSPTLAVAESVLVFLWERIPGVSVRSVALDVGTDETAVGRATITATPTSPPVEPVRVQPPLAGGPWVALYDPHMPRGHRRVAFSRGSRVVVPARFAVDWVRLDEAGRPNAAEADDFGGWFGFGADVLAAADGRVVAVRDSYPDVLTRERPAKWTEDDVAGNYVGLELSSGRFAFYEHLQRESVRVKVGDSVRAGEPIARLGRSGVNSSGPHLHFHVSSDPSTLDAQGRPWALSQFQLLGGYPSITAALSGTPWSAASGSTSSAPLIARDRLPEPNSVVKFDSRAF